MSYYYWKNKNNAETRFVMRLLRGKSFANLLLKPIIGTTHQITAVSSSRYIETRFFIIYNINTTLTAMFNLLFKLFSYRISGHASIDLLKMFYLNLTFLLLQLLKKLLCSNCSIALTYQLLLTNELYTQSMEFSEYWDC